MPEYSHIQCIHLYIHTYIYAHIARQTQLHICLTPHFGAWGWVSTKALKKSAERQPKPHAIALNCLCKCQSKCCCCLTVTTRTHTPTQTHTRIDTHKYAKDVAATSTSARERERAGKEICIRRRQTLWQLLRSSHAHKDLPSNLHWTVIKFCVYCCQNPNRVTLCVSGCVCVTSNARDCALRRFKKKKKQEKKTQSPTRYILCICEMKRIRPNVPCVLTCVCR